MNIRNIKRKKGVSLVVIAFSVVVLLVFAGFSIDVGYILNVQSELQKATETAALKGAASYGLVRSGDKVKLDDVKPTAVATSVFTAMTGATGITANAAVPDVQKNTTSEAVSVQSSIDVTPIFMSLIGMDSITIQSQAQAISSPFYLSRHFPRGISAGSLMANYSGDSKAKKPIGDNNNLNGDGHYDNVLGQPDGKSLSLGCYGYITARLPLPLVDENGFDLFIKESGNLDGYMVFAGNDNDPNSPYINEISPGAGISWKNISQFSAPVGVKIGQNVGSYLANVDYAGGNILEPKVYGSALFDIGAAGLSSVKYIKIIDDGKEDGFLLSNTAQPIIFIGDHSSVTPGADIDAVAVLHHSKLIPFNDMVSPDGLLHSLKDMLSLDKSSSDTDRDGLTDAEEIHGYSTANSNIINITGANSANSTRDSNPIVLD